MARRDGNGVGGNGSGNAISRIGGVSNGGGTALKGEKVGAPGGEGRVQVRYDVHLTTLSRRDGENSQNLLTGTVLPTLHSHVLCNNCHLCGVCWED